MKKYMIFVIAVLMYVGCGDSESPQTVKKEIKRINYIDLGTKQLEEHNIQDAVRSFYQAIAEEPQNVEPLLVLGRLFTETKNYDKAIEHYKRAAELQPDNGQIYFALARCYGLKGDNEEALNNVKRSVTIFKAKNDQEHYQSALILLRKLTESDKDKEQEQEEDQMMERGRITKLVSDKKYGTITMDDGREAHFHQQCLGGANFEDLEEGQEIECYVKNVMNGYLAIEIRLCQKEMAKNV